MNRCYRLVWNRNSERWVVANEHARSRGKRSGSLRVVCAAAAAVFAGFTTYAHALPAGGQVSAGTGSIAQSGTAMTVTQGTHKLAVNWNSFGIGADESVTFRQPDSSAIALNRVLGTDPSQIYGRLSANGQVFLLNPNGLLFGAGAQVNVGGLVASTLNLSDSDFMAGRYSFAGSGGSIVNQGAISAADGGYVALLGAQVSNEGTIQARLGTVALAAGKKVTLDFAGDSLVSLQVDEGVVDALAQNKQLIRADGGTALLTAKAAGTLEAAVVNNSGVVEAQTIENHGGVIRLLGDAQNGVAQVGGTLDASAPNGGDGGQVETSAAKVQVADGTVVTTAAPAGRDGTWLIDPQDYSVAASGGDITGADLSSNLNLTNVIVESSGGGSSGAGNVNVNDAVSWGSGNTLTLTASNDVNVTADISGAGLELNANTPNGGETASGTGSVNIANSSVSVNGAVSVSGVDLNVGSATETAPSLLQSSDLSATLSGNVNVVAGSGSGMSAIIRSSGTQSISADGNLALSAGEGTDSSAMIQSTGGSDQSVFVGGSISANAGGNSSNGSGNKAYVLKGGSGLQTVSAASVQLSGGGGSTGAENKAAILTAPGSSASQQVTIGAGGLTVVAGGGAGAGNTAGVWVLDDYPGGSGTTSSQVVNVAGDVLITGGAGNVASGHNNASIFQSSTGAGASQMVSVGGSITLTGAASGISGGAFITSNAPSQAVSASGIAINGGGGADGTNDGAGIFQNNAGGGQSVSVNGGGSINITGGSGTGGWNTAQIYSVGSGAQTINFTPSGAINLTGGTGVIDSTAGSSNYAKIETTAGDQTITGLPSITILGGTGGGTPLDPLSTTNLGNYAFIRADSGTQNINAGTISLAAGASGINSSATIQGPNQMINASSVSVSGGGATGLFSGARIGGHGGYLTDQTNLTLTTSPGGTITVSGGSASGAAIGGNSLGETTTNVTIYSGGDITLAPGTGAGVRIGAGPSLLSPGTITIVSQGNIALGANGSIGSGIYTLGDVSLTANAPGGSIVEQSASRIVAHSLTTVSDAGTLLQGANQVDSFGSINFSSGDVVLNDSVTALEVTNVWNGGFGGSVAISNSGEMDVTGNVSTANGGNLLLAAGGDLRIGNAAGSASVVGGTDAGNAGGMTLYGANIDIFGGDGDYSGTYVGLNGIGTQLVTTPGNLTLQGGEGTSSGATIAANNAVTQSVSVGAALVATAGGNGSSGSNDNAYVMQSGSGMQTVDAGSIVLTGGGGATGMNNSAAIMTSPTSSSGSQQVTAGALVMQGGTGSGSGNKAGIWMLDDYTTDHGTSSAQTLTVTGNISLTGGSNADAAVPSNNNASIFQSSTGSAAVQTVSALGSITLTGGASGANGGAYISSLAPNQSVSAGSGGIALQGGGGVDGLNDTAAIVQNNVLGSQSVEATGGGSISLAGGSGNRGSNSAGIYSVGSGPQTINFPTGGALAVTGGSGVPLSTAASSNFARIEATAGSQSIMGAPSITIQGGSGGADLVGSTNLGNYAFIRGDAGVQTIEAGAITLTAGASGTNNSATLQGSTQVINASSVAINGGGGGGVFPGSRIGGHGGTIGGATNLTLNTSGAVTLTGGSVSGAAIGSHAGWTTDIAINAGGDVTLAPGTGAGVRIGSPAGSVSGGNISIVSKGNITLGENGSIGSGIYTLGDVNLDVTTGPIGKSIVEATASAIVANSLTTVSDAGTLLPGANQVGSFSATNYSSGDIVLNDSVGLLNVTNVWNNAPGGSVSIGNPGEIDVTGNVFTADGGDLSLTAGGDLLIGNPSAGISVFGGSSPANTGNMTLEGANIGIFGGTGPYNTSVGLTGSGVQQVTTPGNLTISASALPNGGVYLTANDSAAQSISAGNIVLSGGEGVSNAASIVQSGSGSQTVAATGAILASAGGNSSNGSFNNAYISDSGSGAQLVSANSISLTGGGGVSGASNAAGIYKGVAGGTQNITVNGGGAISINGGSGTGGANLAQIYSQSGDPQSIAFTSGGSINLEGGTGAPVSTAPTSNFARIEATAGSQSITGAPSISIQGGSDGSDLVGSTNLGNFAFIRADTGLQSIDAGAIALTAGASGFNNSASIQGPSQVINASSVTIAGGGGMGSLAGSRIGGHGGTVGGPTDLTLTTSGSITLTGGSTTGAGIGSDSLGGGSTDIAINAGGDVTLAPGTGAGVRIGSTPSTLSPGTISITSGGNITLAQTGGIGSGIFTTGDVSLTASAPGGSILEQPASRILAGSLTTVSDAGTLLDGTNQVAVFDASNVTSGNVSLVNMADPLTITGITNNGGDISVDNTGAIVTTGLISAPSGSVSIVSHSPLTIGSAGVSAGGGVTLSAGQTADPGDSLTLNGPVASTGSGSIVLYAGDDLLQNSNVSSNGGSVSATSEAGSITMAAGTTTSSGGGSIGYAAPSGDINVSSLDAGTGAIDLNTGGNVQPTSGSTGVNLTGGSANVTAGGDVTLTTQLTQPASVTAGGTTSVTNVSSCGDDDACDGDDDREHHGNNGHHKHRHDRGHHRHGDGDRGKDGSNDD